MKAKSESRSKPKDTKSLRNVSSSGNCDPSPDCAREQKIAEAAYFYAERRGFVPGNELSDWLQAEADVEALLATRH